MDLLCVVAADFGGEGVDHLHGIEITYEGVDRRDIGLLDLIEEGGFGLFATCEDEADLELFAGMGEGEVLEAGEGGDDDIFAAGGGDDELVLGEKGAEELGGGGGEADLLKVAKTMGVASEELGFEEEGEVVHGGVAEELVVGDAAEKGDLPTGEGLSHVLDRHLPFFGEDAVEDHTADAGAAALTLGAV